MKLQETLSTKEILQILQKYAADNLGLFGTPEVSLRFNVNKSGGYGTDFYELVADVKTDK